MWEAGYALAGLNNPELFGAAEPPYALRYATTDGMPRRTMGGLTILPDLGLADVVPETSALLVLVGGVGWDEGKDIEAVALAKRFLDAGVPVAAICGATAALARGGLLDTVAHTSNAAGYLLATGYQGARHYRTEQAVTDGNVITANTMVAGRGATHLSTPIRAPDTRRTTAAPSR